MGKYTPRPVPRGFFDMGTRSNAYEALLHACWWLNYCGMYRGPLPVQVRHRAHAALHDITVLWPKVDGPRSLRVGARRAVRRAVRTAARILRTTETA